MKKNFKNTKKILKYKNLKKIYFLFKKSKIKNTNYFLLAFITNPLFLNIRTKRFNQSSPVQPNPEKKFQQILKIFKNYFVLQKIYFFMKIFISKKKCSSLTFANWGDYPLTGQTSPIHLVSESRGGTLSVTDKVRKYRMMQLNN